MTTPTTRRSAGRPHGRTRRSADPARGRIWRSAWILTCAGPPLADGAVAVREGRVAEVGTADAVLRNHPDLPVEDGGHRIIAPGFVDAHCHLEWSLLDELLPPADFVQWLGGMLGLRSRMLPGDFATAARHGALRAVRAGTTTLADSGPTGAGAQALGELGMRGVVHLEAFGRQEGEEATAEAARFAERIAVLEGWEIPDVRIGVSPHAPYTVGPALWRALQAHPGLAERSWATHLAESRHEREAIAAGEGALAALFRAAGLVPGRWGGPAGAGVVARVVAAGAARPGLVAAHCVHLDEADPRALAEVGVAVAHCPRSNTHLRCGRAPIEHLRAAGVPVALGTDSPASGGDYDLRAEARACMDAHLGHAPIDASAALDMITVGGARALGLTGEAGSIEAGMRADLVVLDPPAPTGDPVAASLDAGTRVGAVVVAGRVVVRSGASAVADSGALGRAVAEARGRLC